MNAGLRTIREDLGQRLKIYRAKRARARSKAIFIGATGSSLAWAHDVKCWIPACGKKEGCQDCALFEVPFEEHWEFVNKRRNDRWRQRLRRLFGG